jgi:hypothetical protein
MRPLFMPERIGFDDAQEKNLSFLSLRAQYL